MKIKKKRFTKKIKVLIMLVLTVVLTVPLFSNVVYANEEEYVLFYPYVDTHSISLMENVNFDSYELYSTYQLDFVTDELSLDTSSLIDSYFLNDLYFRFFLDETVAYGFDYSTTTIASRYPNDINDYYSYQLVTTIFTSQTDNYYKFLAYDDNNTEIDFWANNLYVYTYIDINVGNMYIETEYYYTSTTNPSLQHLGDVPNTSYNYNPDTNSISNFNYYKVDLYFLASGLGGNASYLSGYNTARSQYGFYYQGQWRTANFMYNRARDEFGYYYNGTWYTAEGRYNVGYTSGANDYGIVYNDDLVDADFWGWVEYQRGLQASNQEAYDKGFLDGSNESFSGNLHIWLVPAIIVVLFGGGFLYFASRRRE